MCTEYKLEDYSSNDYSNFMNNLSQVSPQYTTLEGWKCDISGISSFDDLPENAKKYVEYLQGILNTKIRIVSIGPERNQIIKL